MEYFTVVCFFSIGIIFFSIGIIGLWDLMNDILSIVLAAVFISLFYLDFYRHPDFWQFFFGLGEASIVIAITIYVIVPIIR